ncbi:MAG: hypothetical protein ACRD1E_01365 [Terriglobales bacterium]
MTAEEMALKDLLNSWPDRLPYGLEVDTVELLAGTDRKEARKHKANAKTRSSKGNSLFVTLRPREAERAALPPAGVDRVGELLRALQAAEQTPGHGFVALKWFRDSFLPRQGLAWALTPEARDLVLRDATARGWVRVQRIPNPRNPEFPTSTLQLAVGIPEVRSLLGLPEKLGWDFPRIKIEGEPMSETVRRMRDEGY